MNALATIRKEPPDRNEEPSSRAIRLMGNAIEAMDRGRVQEAADWLGQANSVVQTIIQFRDARAGRT